jgi:hypothetical protein
MHRTLKIIAMAVMMSTAAYGQSLGEVARENREKQTAEESSAVKPKVITNQDLGEGPEGRPDLSVTRPAPGSGNWGRAWGQPPAGLGSAGQSSADPFRRTGQQAVDGQPGQLMRRQIQEQENRVASLQARIDQMNAPVRSSGASTPGAYGRSQSWQLERAAQMQRQLDEQKQRLDMMEEQARRMAPHSSVFDQ